MSLNDLDYENVRLVDPATGLICLSKLYFKIKMVASPSSESKRWSNFYVKLDTFACSWFACTLTCPTGGKRVEMPEYRQGINLDAIFYAVNSIYFTVFLVS